MKKLDMDFAHRGLVFWCYRAPWHLWVVAFLAMLLVLLGWLQWSALRSDLQRLANERVQMVLHQERQTSRPSPSPRLTAEQFKAFDAAIRQLNQPWLELLETLESTRKGRVALLELRFDPLNHRIKGVAEAKNSQEMLNFVSQLKAQPLVLSAQLSLHQISQSDPNKPYRFEFSADWQDEEHRP